MRFNSLIIFTLLFLQNISSQTVPNNSELTIQQIMQGEKFVGYLPENIEWSDDSKWIYFSWNPEMDTLRSWYKVAATGGEPIKLEFEEYKDMPERGDYSKNFRIKAYEKDGDIFIESVESGETKRVTNTFESELNPQILEEEEKMVFKKGNNLFSIQLDIDHSIPLLTQITNFQKGSKNNSKRILPAYEQWLENDQLEWFEVLEERKTKSEIRKRRREKAKSKRLTPYYIGGKSISNQKIDPTGKFVTFKLTRYADAKSTDVPNYVTKSGQVENIRSREKVGFPQDTYEMGVYDVERDTTYLIDSEKLEGIFDKPAFLEAYHKDTTEYSNKYSKPRALNYHGPVFSEDGKAVIVLRAMDNKDRWICLLDLPTGDLKILDRQRDEAWVGGPGISGWNFSTGTLGWIDNETIYFQSEKTGFSHLYSMNVNSGKQRQLTKGNFEILNVDLSRDRSTFYVSSNKETPHEQHFYKMPVAGGKMQKITSKKGNHRVEMSPDEKWLAIRYSYSNKPWELYIMPNEVGAEMTQITKSTTENFQKYDWRDPEIVRFKASDGVEVPARIYKPKEGAKNGAAVIFVHGAGYLQNVHSWWSTYYREFMFHNILADNGYTVLDIDYRASRGYGRDWRTAIYQHMGSKDLSDQIDGAKYLAAEHGIDENRIGIYGGSYGGFITLMGLFTSPGTFKSGAALRSVTDWAHYNHPYASNILNTPVEDSLAYYKSSPIYHAEGLQDNLLILHGMIDDNVQFQDVVRLAQRLIELGKENWEFAVFPMERHGFVEPSSWTDEYRRIFKLFQETLRE